MASDVKFTVGWTGRFFEDFSNLVKSSLTWILWRFTGRVLKLSPASAAGPNRCSHAATKCEMFFGHFANPLRPNKLGTVWREAWGYTGLQAFIRKRQ